VCGLSADHGLVERAVGQAASGGGGGELMYRGNSGAGEGPA
jgi:hypothetical protein